LLDVGLRLTSGTGISIFGLRTSPYKSLSYVLQVP